MPAGWAQMHNCLHAKVAARRMRRGEVYWPQRRWTTSLNIAYRITLRLICECLDVLASRASACVSLGTQVPFEVDAACGSAMHLGV